MIANIYHKDKMFRINLAGLSIQEIFATLTSNLIAKHPFISKDALITNMKQIVEMMNEVCPAGKELTKLTTSINKRIAVISKFRKETDLLENDIWDSVLSFEGMSNLRGFGFCNKYSKDTLSGNAERISLTSKIKENN